ncbi:MAG TPA: hypothetical protein VJU77_14195 [Chthoniobacterales bacterium]|nr:hypothetical protein [Chthoniobacterales bacterium]
MLAQSQITLSANGGSPDILTIFGNANWGGYDIYLWDSPTHYEIIGSNDGTQQTNRFSLRHSPAELVTRRLVWQGVVRPFDPASKGPFSVKCGFYQNNQLVTTYDVEPKAAGQFSGPFEYVVIICTFTIG